MKGTKANLVIRQGQEQNYKPQLIIEPAPREDLGAFANSLKIGIAKIQDKYPGVEVQKSGYTWVVKIPEKYHNGHEAHFGQVTEKYLQYLTQGTMPAWEVPNMITKYYITTQALEIAKQENNSVGMS